MPDSEITFRALDGPVTVPDRAGAARYLLDDALNGFGGFGYGGRADQSPDRMTEALCGIGAALLALNETLAARPAVPEPPRRSWFSRRAR